MNILEIIAMIATITCVVLSIKENVLCWPISIISELCLISIYFQHDIYAQIGLQSVFLIQNLFGWYNWGKPNSVKLSNIKTPNFISDILLVIILSTIFASLNIKYNNKEEIIAYLDSIAAFIGLLANWYLTRKIIQTWVLFMVYNMILVILLWSQGLYIISLLNVFLFFISFNGLITWKKNLKFMDKELLVILKNKNFYSMLECIEYLYFAGYTLDESVYHSSFLFSTTFDLDLSDAYDEKTLFLLNQLNGCEIKTSPLNNDKLYYVKNKKILFEQDLKNRYLWVNCEEIWEIFEVKYSMNHQQIQDFITDVLDERVKLKGYTPSRLQGTTGPNDG